MPTMPDKGDAAPPHARTQSAAEDGQHVRSEPQAGGSAVSKPAEAAEKQPKRKLRVIVVYVYFFIVGCLVAAAAMWAVENPHEERIRSRDKRRGLCRNQVDAFRRLFLDARRGETVRKSLGPSLDRDAAKRAARESRIPHRPRRGQTSRSDYRPASCSVLPSFVTSPQCCRKVCGARPKTATWTRCGSISRGAIVM